MEMESDSQSSINDHVYIHIDETTRWGSVDAEDGKGGGSSGPRSLSQNNGGSSNIIGVCHRYTYRHLCYMCR